MNTVRICPKCKQPLPADAPEGLCPACLLQPTRSSLANPPAGPGAHTEPLATRTMPPRLPTVRYFGDYELLGELAQGGMGVVYHARQTTLNREVALKMILTGTLASAAEVERFKTEAEAAAKLDHPNIVPIYETGEHEGRHYFSMKFVKGGSLAELIAGSSRREEAPFSASASARLDSEKKKSEPPYLGCYPIKEAAALVAKVARAVHYAHQRGILHRDIKPRNILLDERGEPLLTDFGLAKLMEKQTDLTQSMAVMGSANYMSPEQASGKAKEVTTAADVYALGAVLYETLTGQPPFRADNVMETLRKMVEEEPKSPRELNRAVDRDLATICLKCLEKDPKRRYGSAEALADELERWLRSEPILARPAGALDRARKWARREPAQVVTLGVVAAAVLVLIGGVLLANRGLNSRLWESLVAQARAERLAHNRAGSLDAVAEAARLHTNPHLRDEAIQTLAQAGVRLERRVPFGKEAWFTLSADGNLLMAAGIVHSYPGRKQTDTPKVRVYETATGKLVNETGWEPLGPLPAFSPDARVVALPQDDDAITIWEPRTGKELSRVTGDGALMFSPDGHWLAIAESNSLKVVRWANPKEVKLRASGAFLSFTRDGDALVRDGERIVKWNFRESAETPLTPAGLKPLAVNAEGKFAALWDAGTNNASGSIVVFDLLAGKQLAVLRNQRQSSIPVRFSADGRLLAFSDTTDLDFGQQAVRIYDVETGRYRRSLTGVSPKPGPFKKWRSWWSTNQWDLQFDVASPGAIYGGQFIGDGSLFAAITGINELFVTVWSTETGEPVATLPKSSEFAASADGRWLVSMGEGSFMHYANGDTYAINMDDSILAQTAGVPSGAKELPRGRGSLGGADMGTSGLVLQLWSVASGVPTYQVGSEIHRLEFSRDGRMLTAGGRWNNTSPSRLWNVESRGGRPALHPVTELPIRGRVFFAGENQVWEAGELSGANPAEFKVLTRQLAPERREFPVNIGFYNGGPAFSPDGRRMLVASYGYGTNKSFTVMTNQTMLLWDSPTMKLVKAHPVMSSDWSPGVSVFSPDGKRIATSAFVHQGLDVFDAATLTRQWHAQRPKLTEGEIARIRLGWLFGKNKDRIYDELGVSQIAFTPDGKRIASVSANFLMLRDADTGAELGVGYGHEGYIQSLAMSPDGKYAVTGGLDRTIRVWEIPTAREVARWEAHDSAVTALAFSPDGTTLASGSVQGALKLWNVPVLRRDLAGLGLDW